MKRKLCSYLLLSCLSLVTLAAEPPNPNDFWKFYEKYPHLQDFFPFGMYGGGTGNWSQFGQDPQAMNDMVLDIMSECGLNITWDTSFTRTVRRYEKDGKPFAELTDFGHWWYGEALPAYDFKAMPSLIQVFTRTALQEYQRQDPPLSEEELLEIAEQWQGVLNVTATLVQDYPETIVGFVSDDEPRHIAPTVAADKLISRISGRPVTTCIPSWGQGKVMIPHMQPFTGDWYVTSDHARNNWAIARNLKWMQENHPDRIFWFLPLASSYSAHEATKPWLLDARPQPVDLRMQFWMAIAGGCKGFFYYHLLYGIDWARGEDNLLSAAYVPNNDLWAELNNLAPMITSVGPLLISCRPDAAFEIGVECGSVRYPEYEGPAVSHGLLRDIKYDRFIFVPYSNDLYERQKAGIRFPDALLNGRSMYDLVSLEPVGLESGRLALELDPGHGRLLLIANDAEIAAARTTVLRHRTEQAQRRAKIALRRIRPENADALEAAAATAIAAGNWEQAMTAYNDLTAAVEKTFATGTGNIGRKLYAAGSVLHEIAAILTETDDLFRCYSRPLQLHEGQSMIWGIRGHGTKYARKEVGDWMACLNMYLDLRLRYRAGENMGSTVHNTALTLRDMASANRKDVRKLIDERLAQVRHPLTIACITGDRRSIEYHANISWLWENFTLQWFAPGKNGKLQDRDGNNFEPAQFDAVWIHQLRYSEAPQDGGVADVAGALMPALLQPQTLNSMKDYLREGGGLVLSGIAGLYVLPLGLEEVQPDRVQENSWYEQAFAVGLAAAPGCSKHPVFEGLDANGYLSNGTYPGHNLVPECAWQKKQPAGTVVAIEYDEMFGPMADYAAVVEYMLGKGRVMILGGRALDLTPGTVKDTHFSKARALNRRMLENALLYTAGDTSFVPERVAAGTQKQTVERHLLPQEEWLFRLDPENVGLTQDWFARELDTEDWKPIRIGLNWESQGYDYDGHAWYRRPVEMQNKPGKRTLLHFGAVDEEAVVWIDGKEVGRHEKGPSGWDKPFHFDITDMLGPQKKPHLLTVRVHDSMAAGGIWKPVWITWE